MDCGASVSTTPLDAPLTDRQAAILAFIEYHWVAYCRAPTLRAIADRFEFSSTNAVNDVLKALTRKGALVPRERGDAQKPGCILPYSVRAWLRKLPREAPL